MSIYRKRQRKKIKNLKNKLRINEIKRPWKHFASKVFSYALEAAIVIAASAAKQKENNNPAAIHA